jgi:predicted phosphodiesterase
VSPDLAGPAESCEYRRVAVFGGVYSNHFALQAALADARARGVDEIVFLGDLGAFGPHPDEAAGILKEAGIPVVRGNYDDSIARGLDDCQCGYTDPADNHFARLSYQYTFENTSADHRAWMGTFPSELRFRLGDLSVLACHGSPRQTNEFLWESTTPTHFLQKLGCDSGVDVILGTHTGIHWMRGWGDLAESPSSGELAGGAYVNVGALGRPANDGRTQVWYAVLEARGRELSVEFVPIEYDHRSLALEMRSEGLPEPFAQTILTGWWTTCLEILPGKERARGKF